MGIFSGNRFYAACFTAVAIAGVVVTPFTDDKTFQVIQIVLIVDAIFAGLFMFGNFIRAVFEKGID